MSKRTTSNVRIMKAAVSDAISAISQGLADGVAEAAHAVRDDARKGAPVDEGTLRDGIGAQVRGLEATVAVFDQEANHGTYIEHGTSNRPARPFMLPAVERERKQFVKRLTKHVERKL